MNISIMQPYFFPYLGYFSLIKHTNEFIIFDPVQFIRHGWIERNRILKPAEGWQYIQVPLQKHSRGTLIKDISINNNNDWGNMIISQLQHYKKAAPYFKIVVDMLKDVFSNEYVSIVDLNLKSIQVVCEYLEIKKTIVVFSNMNLAIEHVNAPDEWALNICKALGNVDEYWNPPGGMSFFDRSKYESNQIKLKFQKICLMEYNQKRANFESALSIIDVMMFNPPKKINQMLDKYELL